MAASALALSTLTPNGSIADPTGTALVAGAGNGLSIAANLSYNPMVFLRVANASGSTANVTINAGSQPSAISSGQGSLVVSQATATTKWYGPFDSSRFQQPDGSTLITADQALTVTAFAIDGRRV